MKKYENIETDSGLGSGTKKIKLRLLSFGPTQTQLN
jgi:hypothetical protein